MAWRLGLATLFLLGWLIALLPLKAVTIAVGGMASLGYRDVFGTVWDGRIYGLRLNGRPVREVAVSLDPVAVLTGQFGGRWRVEDGSLRGEGHARLGRDRIRARDVSLVVDLGRLGGEAWPGINPQAPVFIRLARLDMAGERCLEAAGSVRSDALADFAAAHGVAGPPLEGEITCRGEELVVLYAGETEAFSLEGEIVLRRAGYDWTVAARTETGELADAFALAGLERDGNAWRTQGSGHYGARN